MKKDKKKRKLIEEEEESQGFATPETSANIASIADQPKKRMKKIPIIKAKEHGLKKKKKVQKENQEEKKNEEEVVPIIFEDDEAQTISQLASQPYMESPENKEVHSKAPLTFYYEAMTDRIQNYYAKIDKVDVEAAVKEGLTVEE